MDPIYGGPTKIAETPYRGATLAVPAECPNCRQPISRMRVLFMPLWGQWLCAACGSVLGINKRRRLLAMIPWVAFLVLFLGILRITNWGDWVAVPLLVAAGFLNFVLLDRAVVLERTGFRCRQCGYDLRGQRDPRCPECGQRFDPAEPAFLQADLHRDPPPASPSRSRHLWTLLVFVPLTLALLLGLVVLQRARTRAARRPPPPAVSQPAPATEVRNTSPALPDEQTAVEPQTP